MKNENEFKRTPIDDLIADWLQANGLRLEERPTTGGLEDLARRIHEYKDTEAQATIIRQQKKLQLLIKQLADKSERNTNLNLILGKREKELRKLKTERLRIEKGSHKNIVRLIHKLRTQDKKAQATTTRQQKELKNIAEVKSKLGELIDLKAENEKLQEKYDKLIDDLQDWAWVSGKMPKISKKDIEDSLKRIKAGSLQNPKGVLDKERIEKLESSLSSKETLAKEQEGTIEGLQDQLQIATNYVSQLEKSRRNLAEKLCDETIESPHIYDMILPDGFHMQITKSKKQAVQSWLEWSEK
jgi:DNA repair exonuclease SbcCD ATPase subunit